MVVIAGSVDGVRVGRGSHRARHASEANGHHAHIIPLRRRRRRCGGVAEFADISIMTGAAARRLWSPKPTTGLLLLLVVVGTAQAEMMVRMRMMMIQIERVLAVMTLGVGQMHRGTAITLLWERGRESERQTEEREGEERREERGERDMC